MSKPIQKLRLNDLKNCQKSLSRIIRKLHEETSPDIAKYRTTGYLIKILIESYQFDKRTDIEDRIYALEMKLEGK